MNRRAQGLLVAVLGMVALRLVVNGSFDSYVKPAMFWPLVAAGAILVVLGLTTMFRAAAHEDRIAASAEPEAAHLAHEHDHDHEGGPAVAWLLVLPLVTLLLVAPPALGADAAIRQTPAVPVYQGSVFPALRVGDDGVADLSIPEFLDRAFWDSAHALDGTPVRLTGLVVHSDELPDGFLLTRFVLTCCAADALPVQVGVRGGGTPEEDTWVEVEGTLVPPDEVRPTDTDLPRVDLEATSVTEIPEPADPYQ